MALYKVGPLSAAKKKKQATVLGPGVKLSLASASVLPFDGVAIASPFGSVAPYGIDANVSPYGTPGVIGSTCSGCSEPSLFDKALDAFGLLSSAPAIAVGAAASLLPDVKLQVGDDVQGDQSNGISNTTLVVVAIAALYFLRGK